MTSIISFFSGKKTYIVAVLLIVAAVIRSDGAVLEELETILTALGLATLRAGVSKSA